MVNIQFTANMRGTLIYYTEITIKLLDETSNYVYISTI